MARSLADFMSYGLLIFCLLKMSKTLMHFALYILYIDNIYYNRAAIIFVKIIFNL